MTSSVTATRVRWLNPPTLRGAAFLTIGVFVLAVPDASARLLGLALAVGLLVLGVTDLWAASRTRPTPWTIVLVGVGSIVVGASMVLLPGVAAEFFVQLLALVLAVRGVSLTVSSIRTRRTSEDWTFNLVQGALSVAAAAVIFVLPEAITTALVLVTAATLITAGAIMMSYGLAHDDPDRMGAVALGGYVRRWFDQRDVGDETRLSVIDALYFEPPDSGQKQIGFWVLLVLSTTIATLAILADSTAVVIGAMLVAPLMTPILGMSAGIVNGWMNRVARSFATVAGGVGVSVLTAWIVASWAPHFVPIETNSQVVSRISPTLIDMMIAVAAGAAGAYATVDKRVSSSITGVAIAVALVPPLGVIGVTLTVGNYGDALGAFILFLTNLVSIILAAALVFVLTGFALITKLQENREKMRTVISTVLLGALIVMVPLAFTSEGIISSASRQAVGQEVTTAWLGEQENLRLNRVEVRGSEVSVIITGEGDIPPVAELDEALSDAFGARTSAAVEYFPSRLLTADK